MLARAIRPVPVDTLVDALWGGRAEPSSAKKLQLHVHRLRRALGASGRIRFEHSGYAVRVHPGELDADRFETLLAEGITAAGSGTPARAVELLRKALQLWRGEPYDGFADVPMLRGEVEQLSERRLVACEQLHEASWAWNRARTCDGSSRRRSRTKPEWARPPLRCMRHISSRRSSPTGSCT